MQKIILAWLLLCFCWGCQTTQQGTTGAPVRARKKPAMVWLDKSPGTQKIRLFKRKDPKPKELNISAEQWDCPQDPNRKMVPSSVKKNIKRNKNIIQNEPY
ncbi:hypothetical protein DQQ10_22210 [Pseudochryseolinea flava]|uniref:Uncharacterized protein n=1 Tax=Pseudochryseolinea flava TaxID=2059302 RepID=A0A364XX10_9BACT|nr:hypothetical protein DQQ10_22210 [Pseudochryseolinea flava]